MTPMFRATAADASRLAGRFECPGELVEARPLGEGHIHDTFVAGYRLGETTRRYVHQRVNDVVFPDIPAVMENIVRVTEHLRGKIASRGGDPDREALTVVPTSDGESFLVDEQGHTWRTYLMIEDAVIHQHTVDPHLAEATTRAFGRFQNDLANLPGGPLRETIPGFHDTVSRLAQLREALAEDLENRAAEAAREVAFVQARAESASRLVDLLATGEISSRVCHNDTKLNNVLFDRATGEPLCVLDLDTVMPGSPLLDFGDAVRYGASTASEDEVDPDRVDLSMSVFEAMTRGYLGEARGFLSEAEVELLPFACRLITLELGMRFLTDHLEGDRYFKVARPGHNLVRCRNQFALVGAMEARDEEMLAAVNRCRKETL